LSNVKLSFSEQLINIEAMITASSICRVLNFCPIIPLSGESHCPGKKLPPTLSYKTYACKYLHLCPTLLPKFISTHFKNLRYSICIIACVSGCFHLSLYILIVIGFSTPTTSSINVNSLKSSVSFTEVKFTR